MKRVSLFAGIASLVFGLSASAGPLQDMINAATNDTVVVPPGTYNEPIALKDGLMLISQEGPDTTIIEAPAGVAMAVAGAKDSAIVGFTIHGGQFGINNLGNFIGVFECNIANYGAVGIVLEKGSAAIVNNLVSGTKSTAGISCTEANPYVGYNIIENNHTGFAVSRWLIPTLDHNVFLSNDVAIISGDGTDIVMNGNIFDGNGQNVSGSAKLGTNDQVRAATAEELKLRRGLTAESYRSLMKKVFEESASMQPRIMYDLTDVDGRFNLIVTYPYATFSVSASARDTVIKAYDAYDRQTDAALNAQYLIANGGYPTVAVINPQITEKNQDRFVLEKVFEHLPSYNTGADGKRTFNRLTNLSRIEVILPIGWAATAMNPGSTIEQRGNRQVVKLLAVGMTQLHIEMAKTAPVQ